MLNYIWFGMMAIAVVVGIFNGKIDDVTDAATLRFRDCPPLAPFL